MLKARVLSSVILLPLLVLSVWFDSPLPWFTVVVCLMALLGVIEFFRLTGVSSVRSITAFGVVLTLGLVLMPYCNYRYCVPLLLSIVTLGSFVLTVWRDISPGRFIRWAWMLLGSLYIGWLLSIFVELRNVTGFMGMPELGRNLVFLALLATFASDTFAYFTGKAIGRHKMAPVVSPGKTWEGAAGGVAGAILVGWIVTLNWPLQLPFLLWQSLLMGGCISIFGQLGDLAESLLKRLADTKDSGTLIPGHGGALDRMDSILPAGVVVYVFYILFIV